MDTPRKNANDTPLSTGRPARSKFLSSKLADPNNTEQPPTPSLRHSKRKPPPPESSDSDDHPVRPVTKRKVTIIEVLDEDDDVSMDVASAPSPIPGAYDGSPKSQAGPSRPQVAPKAKSAKSKGKRKATAAASDDELGDDGLLADLDHISSPTRRKAPASTKTTDIREFFHNPFKTGGKNVRNCRKCFKDVQNKRIAAGQYQLVDEHTTLRRHLERYHKADYLAWCTKTGFEPRLPNLLKEAKLSEASGSKQISLDQFAVKQEKIVPYSDERFRQAAIEWLVATDQPVQALEHPKFVEMINVSARAINGVKVPSAKVTRTEIMKLFSDHIYFLREHLNGPKVKGKISTTCDCWSSSNRESYFAVTVHWIEETSPGVWELRSDLAGFVSLPRAHSGLRLGQALFKVLRRIRIVDKVGWVSCDNASNNSTMMKQLADQITDASNQEFIAHDRLIACLAHIINLATQAFLGAHSHSPHFNPLEPDAHVTVLEDDNADIFDRDVIGLVRAIGVKVRSSTKRKNQYLEIQASKGRAPGRRRMLLLDMPIRWSSTYAMLKRAYEDRKYIRPYLRALSDQLRKSNKPDKAVKIRKLDLSEQEWDTVERILELLEVSDAAQHAFSADKYPTLYNALPALESLQTAWTSMTHQPRYSPFVSSMNAALSVIAKYHDRLELSDAHIIAMVLHPQTKMDYLDDEWDPVSAARAKEIVKSIFKHRFTKLSSGTTGSSSMPLEAKVTGLAKLRMIGKGSTTRLQANQNSWETEYEGYISTKETMQNMSVVAWWGMNATRFPTWASLARDYLAIMASSVSSERAFSSAGITISKRRNRLKGDIVEALQCVKAALRGDPPMIGESFTLEDEVDSEEEGPSTSLPELVLDLDTEDEADENIADDDFLPSDVD